MDALLDEIESLEAILMDDVQITKNASGHPELIETTVFPTVGEEVDSQYVCITLQVMPGPNYPDVPPNFKLKNPRGLDDRIINAIEAAVRQKLSDAAGQPVVFDLIDIIREQLTESNLPTGQCVICLYGFQDGDEFTKTVCYHYLHSHCLACHINASRRNYEEEVLKLPIWKQKEAKPFQALCPVCRDPIDNEVEPLMLCQPPTELENAPKFIVTAELKSLQAQMNRLYLHQKRRGGIIDLEADEGNVIAIETEHGASEGSKSTNDLSTSSTEVLGNVPVPTLPALQKQHSVPAMSSQHHQQQHQSNRGSNSRHAHNGRHHNRSNTHQCNNTSRNGQPSNNNATGSGSVSTDSTGTPMPPTQGQSSSQHGAGHQRTGGHQRNRRHHHNHQNHHHHHGGRGTNGGNSSGAPQKNLSNPCGSDAR